MPLGRKVPDQRRHLSAPAVCGERLERHVLEQVGNGQPQDVGEVRGRDCPRAPESRSHNLAAGRSSGCFSRRPRTRGESHVFRFQPRALRNTREHSRTDLFAVMEREDEIGPTGTRKGFVRAGLALENPSDSIKSGDDLPGLARRPRRHVAAIPIEMECGLASSCSRRSASTRSASTSAFAIASSAVAP